jgi:acetyl esterase/lipase
MSGNRLRSPVVLLALVACACSATALGIATVPALARQTSVTTDVVYGHKDGLALTLDVHRPAHPNGAGLISIVSGGWQSSVELARIFTQAYPPLKEKGFTIFAVRHGSWPRYPLSSIVADMRRSVRFIRQHAKEYGVDPSRLGVFGNSAGGHLALLLGSTGDSGDPSAADAVLRESSRVAAVVANYPATTSMNTPPNTFMASANVANSAGFFLWPVLPSVRRRTGRPARVLRRFPSSPARALRSRSKVSSDRRRMISLCSP